MKERKNPGLIVLLIMIIVGIVFTQNVYARDYKTITTNTGETNNNEKTLKEIYKKGEAIIMYEKETPAVALKVMASSIVNNYSIESTVDFENVKAKNDSAKIKTYTTASKSEKSTTLSMSLVKSDKYSTEELIKMLKEKDWVISAEPNYIVKTNSLTNDTYVDYQWALENKGQNAGTEGLDINPIKTTSENEKVIAIVDSGVDYTHPDLVNAMWQNPYNKEELPGTYGYDFVNKDDDPWDDNMHGTHCAGIIAASSNNDDGITGAIMGAENIKIMALKVGDENGSIDIYSVLQAYEYINKAKELGTDIVAINNSWGGYACIEDPEGKRIEENENICNSLIMAINLLGEKGAISVCAAGNEGNEIDENGQLYIEDYIYDENEEIVYDENEEPLIGNYLLQEVPAGLNSNYIISVGASNENDELAGFSNYGKGVDISAPGTSIMSTVQTYRNDLRPYIYTDEEIDEFCQVYNNFDKGIDEISYECVNMVYNLIDTKYREIDYKQIGNVSSSGDKYFGKNGKSLKWEINITQEDINNGIIPGLKINNIDINGNEEDMCDLTMNTYIEGPKNSSYCVASYIGPEVLAPDETIMQIGNIMAMPGNYWQEGVLNLFNYYWDEETILIDFWNNFDGTLLITLEDIEEPGTYTIYIDNLVVGGESLPGRGYMLLDGTSMATPFVTAAVAVDSNLNENSTALERKERILNSVRTSKELDGKVTTGGTLDLSKLEVIKKELTEIEITQLPTKTSYFLGETIQTDGIKLKAIYSDESEEEITEGFIITPQILETVGEQEIIVSYTEGEITKEATFKVEVKNIELESIEITKAPNETKYIEGEIFNPEGMIVTATYSDGSTKEVTNYTVTDGTNLTAEQTSVTISYEENGVTKTAEQAIKVNAKVLEEIYIEKSPRKTNYQVGDTINLEGIVIIAFYNNGEDKEITEGYTITPEILEKAGEQEVTVSYTEGEITKEATFKVTVLENLEIDLGKYEEEAGKNETYLIGIAPNTTVEEIKEKITTNGFIEIIDGDKEIEVGEELIRTGYALRVSKNSEEKVYIIVVKGDCNGDGKADFSDILKINKHRLNKSRLEGAYLKAGDVNRDQEADFKDILKINKFRLGKITEL